MKHDNVMKRFFAAKNPQGAAEYIAKLTGIEQDNAMQAAERAGFNPEYYANSIRVWMPVRTERV